MVLAIRIGQGPDVISTKKMGCSLAEAPFFWRILNLGEKNRPNFGEDLFLYFYF